MNSTQIWQRNENILGEKENGNCKSKLKKHLFYLIIFLFIVLVLVVSIVLSSINLWLSISDHVNSLHLSDPPKTKNNRMECKQQNCTDLIQEMLKPLYGSQSHESVKALEENLIKASALLFKLRKLMAIAANMPVPEKNVFTWNGDIILNKDQAQVILDSYLEKTGITVFKMSIFLSFINPLLTCR